MTHPRGLCLALFLLLGAAWIGEAAGQTGETGPTLGAEAYEGWRQYSVHCARCHGQDVLGNPVAANLRQSAAAGGPVAEQAEFVGVVKAGRPSRGMPGFANVLDDAQTDAIFAYVKGRADGEIPAGRPRRSDG